MANPPILASDSAVKAMVEPKHGLASPERGAHHDVGQELHVDRQRRELRIDATIGRDAVIEAGHPGDAGADSSATTRSR